jgi:HSP20 family molecular chaperone IbpA
MTLVVDCLWPKKGADAKRGRGGVLTQVGARIPALNVVETKDGVEITTELPRIAEKDINVSLRANPRRIAS